MEFYLIRHGQSVNNASPDALVPDPALTNLGREQANHVGNALKAKGILRLYCSPMLRALQTAEIIGRVLELPPMSTLGCTNGTVYGRRVSADTAPHFPVLPERK